MCVMVLSTLQWPNTRRRHALPQPQQRRRPPGRRALQNVHSHGARHAKPLKRWLAAFRAVFAHDVVMEDKFHGVYCPNVQPDLTHKKGHTATARITPSTGRRSSRQSRRARPAPASSGTLSVSVPVRDVKCWRSQEGRSAVTNTLCTKMHAEELLVCLIGRPRNKPDVGPG